MTSETSELAAQGHWGSYHFGSANPDPETHGIIMQQRLASQHYPSTWTEEAQFDLELWTWHDAHHKDSRYAACPPCLAEWAGWFESRLKEKTAVYDLATELGV